MDAVQKDNSSSLPIKFNLKGDDEKYGTDTTIGQVAKYMEKAVEDLVGKYAFIVKTDDGVDLKTKLQKQINHGKRFSDTEFKAEGIKLGYLTNRGAFRTVADGNVVLGNVKASPTIKAIEQLKDVFTDQLSNIYDPKTALIIASTTEFGIAALEALYLATTWAVTTPIDKFMGGLVGVLSAGLGTFSTVSTVNFVNTINKVEGLVDKDTSEINDFKNYKKQILRELANAQFWVKLSRNFLSGVVVTLSGGGVINQIFKRYVKLPSVGVAIETAAEASDKVAQLRSFASFVAKVNLELFVASSIAIAGRLVKAASSFNSAIDEIKKVNLEE